MPKRVGIFSGVVLDRGVGTSHSLDWLAALRLHECLSIIWPRDDPGSYRTKPVGCPGHKRDTNFSRSIAIFDILGVPYEIRTRVTAVKGRKLENRPAVEDDH